MGDYQVTRLPMIGDQAPAFHAVTTRGEMDFPQDYNGRWVVLFSYPADFTPVCTTEIMTLASEINEFEKLNAELIGLSADSIYSHIAWLHRIKELTWKNMKRVNVGFPLIADISLEISKKYGIWQPECLKNLTASAVYIIDSVGTIRTILYYNQSTGRNIEEIKRILKALQKTEHKMIATPVNWTPEEDVIIPVPDTCQAAKERMENIRGDMYCMDWFLCFQQSED
jgi:peroxiredoxin (alkyl hydroperoxide reductase subunit C)